jgi:NADH-quinone oxidoreductase subunit A
MSQSDFDPMMTPICGFIAEDCSKDGGACAVCYTPVGFFTISRRKQLTGYLPVVIYLGLIVAFGVVSLLMAAVLRPARPYGVKLENYECGAEPIGQAWVQFPVGFYLVALIFVVFDALAVFLIPWTLNLRGLGLRAVGTMALFLGILSLGWVYALKEGILEWK